MKQILEELHLSLEVILLFACGLAMFVLGAALIAVAAGILPYYEAGVYGLLLVMSGLQWQTTGITPFGFAKRSWKLLIPGIAITVTGFIACFMPEVLGVLPAYLVIAIFGIGGMVLLADLVLAPDKYRLWRTLNCGISTRLAACCAAVYVLEILIAGLLLVQIRLPGTVLPVLAGGIFFLFSLALFALSILLLNVYKAYPEADRATTAPGIPLNTIMGMQFGLYMLVLGCLLGTVFLGLLPIAPNTSAMQGTLVVLLGVQALVAGTMMSFTFRRTVIVFLVGLLFVATGAFAIIVPDTITKLLVIFIGAFNILGGLYLLWSQVLPGLKPTQPAPYRGGTESRLGMLLLVLILIMTILSIAFGASMLIENLVPGLIIAFLLACFGLTQFALLYALSVAEIRRLG